MTTPAGKDWAVTSAVERITLDARRQATTTITVTNLRDTPRSGTLAIATDDAARAWFTIASPVRLIDRGAAEQFEVTATVPATAPPADYAFQAQAYATDSAPEENPTYSNRIVLAIPAPPRRRAFQWWWLAIPAALLLVAALTVTLVVTLRPKEVPEPPLPAVVAVPDLTGLDGVAVAAALQTAGLTPAVKHRHDPANAGSVDQSIPPATEVARGTRVEVVISVSLSPPALDAPAADAVLRRLPYDDLSVPAIQTVFRFERTAASVELTWTQPETYVGSWMVVILHDLCLYRLPEPEVQLNPLFRAEEEEPRLQVPQRPEPESPSLPQVDPLVFRGSLPPELHVVTAPALTSTRFFVLNGGLYGGPHRSCGGETWAVMALDDFGNRGPMSQPRSYSLGG